MLATRGRFETAAQAALPLLREKRTWLILIGLAALVVRLPLFFVSAAAEPGGDSQGYLNYADAISSLEFPGMVRTPGYPAFLWVMGLLPGRTEDAVVIAQHLIGIALAVGLVALGWRLFSPAAGVMAGGMAAITPIYVALEDVILPDFMLGAVAFAGAAALAVAATSDHDRTRVLLLAGSLFALAAYVKPVGQVLVFAAPIVFVVSGRGLRGAIRPTAVVTLAMVVVLAPWVVRNGIANDNFGLSNQQGVTLYNRVFEVQGLPVPLDDPDGPLANQLTAEANATDGLRPSSYVVSELTARGFTTDQAIEVQRRLAVKAILKEPRVYLQTSVGLTRRAINEIGDRTWPARLDRAPAVPRKPADGVLEAGRRLGDLWFLLTAHTVLGVVMLLLPGPRRTAATAFLSVGLLILTATALTHGGQYRYSVQAAPAAWLVGSAGLAFVIGAAVTRIRREQAAHVHNGPGTPGIGASLGSR